MGNLALVDAKEQKLNNECENLKKNRKPKPEKAANDAEYVEDPKLTEEENGDAEDKFYEEQAK